MSNTGLMYVWIEMIPGKFCHFLSFLRLSVPPANGKKMTARFIPQKNYNSNVKFEYLGYKNNIRPLLDIIAVFFL